MLKVFLRVLVGNGLLRTFRGRGMRFVCGGEVGRRSFVMSDIGPALLDLSIVWLFGFEGCGGV